MEPDQENRRFKRYFLPVVIQVPDLSDLPLVPEDVSAGGFKVLVTSEPHLDKEIECSIQISDEVFDNCAATIVWAHENGDGTWYAGINIDSLTEDRNFFDMTLNKANETMK
jgi:hypothetical protein